MSLITQNNTKRSILSGFGTVIALVLVLAVITISKVNSLKNGFENVIENNYKKIELATKMRDSIRLRVISLHKMFISTDWFEKDQELLRLYGYANDYRLSREALAKYPEDPHEKLISIRLKKLTQTAQPIVREAAEMIMSNENAELSIPILNSIFKPQEEILITLNELVVHQKDYSSLVILSAREDYEAMLKLTLILCSIIVLITIGIAVMVGKYVASQNDRLTHATNAKSNFLATMSHEIRTPLTSIIGFGETLLDNEPRNESEKKSVHTIIRNGRHLLNIINDILDLSKIESGKIDIEHIDSSIFELISDVTSIVEPQAINNGLAYKVQYEFPLPTMISTDPVRLKQILINLCSNAIKFTESGYISLNVKYDENNQTIAFSVKDSGIGMDQEQLEKVFSAFTQADSSTTRRFGGTGLGLHLSDTFAELLGGNIEAISQPDLGSQFTLTLPIGNINKLILTDSTPTSSTDNTIGLTMTTNHQLTGSILLAEDNIDNQRLIGMYIKRTGADLDIVENGEEAIKQALNHSYDLILMDKQMPVMDGMDAVKELRAKGYKKPIVALTANALQQDKDECITAGCDDFLAKPLDKGKLMDIIARYVTSNVTNNAENKSSENKEDNNIDRKSA